MSLMSGKLCGQFAVINLGNHFEHHTVTLKAGASKCNGRFHKDCLQSDVESGLHEECRRRM